MSSSSQSSSRSDEETSSYESDEVELLQADDASSGVGSTDSEESSEPGPSLFDEIKQRTWGDQERSKLGYAMASTGLPGAVVGVLHDKWLRVSERVHHYVNKLYYFKNKGNGSEGPEFNTQLRQFFASTVRYAMRQWYISIFMGLIWPMISFPLALALSATGITLGIVHFGDECSHNIDEWMLFVGFIHLIGVWICVTRITVFVLGYCMVRTHNKEPRREVRRIGLFLDLFNLVHVMLLIGFYTYGAVLFAHTDFQPDSCADRLYMYSLVYMGISLVRLVYWVPLIVVCLLPITMIVGLAVVEKAVLCMPRIFTIGFNFSRFFCCMLYVPKACLPPQFALRNKLPKIDIRWSRCCCFHRPHIVTLLNEYVLDPLLLRFASEDEISIRRALGHLVYYEEDLS